MAAFETVKLFDLMNAPADILAAGRMLGTAYVADVGEHVVWEVRVGECEWEATTPRNPAERRVAEDERRLHRWLAENGADSGETVLVKLDAP